MYIYTIQKNDLYKAGIEPNCCILENTCKDCKTDYFSVLANILVEVLSDMKKIKENKI